MTSRGPEAIQAKYAARRELLTRLARGLEIEITDHLQGVRHIDRISFRVKTTESFVKKAMATTESGAQKYAHPFEEIEDQVAGRVLVFYRSDIANVMAAFERRLKKVEREHRHPSNAKEFDYETTHLVCMLTPDLVPAGWEALDERPVTFELQVRTLAQHAWAEPQHGFYKNAAGLSADSQRKLYWAAASAWGLDSIWDDLRHELERLPD